jgi:hypothetical protein
LPKTPAPAIWVVLVITDRDGDGDGRLSGVQAVHAVTEIAVAAAATADRTALNSTDVTVTSSPAHADPLQQAACAYYDSL